MVSLFFEVLPMAIGAMVTPTLFALQVMVVSGSQWRPHARAVIAGTAAVFAVYTALILRGMSQLPSANTGLTSRTESIIEFGAGVVVLVVSIWLLIPHPQINQKMKDKVGSHSSRSSSMVYAGIAAYMAVTDFSTLALMLPALHDVTSSTTHIVFKALIVGFVFVCVMMPVLVPPGMVHFGGERTIDSLRRFNNWIMDHQLQVMGVVSGFIGVILVWRGLRGLL